MLLAFAVLSAHGGTFFVRTQSFGTVTAFQCLVVVTRQFRGSAQSS
jgi:hypothetical protein